MSVESKEENVVLSADVRKCLQAAIGMLSPNWDIRDFVAVNPFFGQRNKYFLDAILYAQAATGANLLPKFEFFREQFSKGTILASDLEFAIKQFIDEQKNRGEVNLSPSTLKTDFSQSIPILNGIIFRCLSDHYDQQQSTHYTKRIQREVSHWASAYFDDVQALWSMPLKEKRFFQAWKALVKHDKSVKVETTSLNSIIHKLPQDPHQAIEVLIQRLMNKVQLSDEELTNYLFRLLSTIQGWASYFQKFEFEAQRTNNLTQVEKNGGVADILALRLAYDMLFLDHVEDFESFKKQLHVDTTKLKSAQEQYIWLLAVENTYRRGVLKAIATKATLPVQSTSEVQAQMVFCIDVRSEVMRRHIEKTMPQVTTLGFAGFFGLPISVKAAAHAEADQQCPVLLNAAVEIDETVVGQDPVKILQQKTQRSLILWFLKKIQGSANSCFTFVEVMGLTYIYKILKAATGWSSPNIPVAALGLHAEQEQCLRPNIQPLSEETKNQFAWGALKNMGLTENFSPLVLFFGHGSASANNPYSSGLDCGACAGHNGLSNARVLADILNAPSVREFLKEKNIFIPPQTVFVSGWHNTTLDVLNIDQPAYLSEEQKKRIQEIKTNLEKAEESCRQERAVDLKFSEGATIHNLKKSLLKKANDWSEIRPEWGLARNAAFIVAKRSLTQGVPLNGRSFLHEYNADKDEDLSILELIMTAPMIVTNWINMQYYASTVSPEKFGTGNKVLHNVVAGIGCLQGNASDLLSGLSEQSVLYKGQYFHEPLRLQVFIQAKTENIDRIMNKHKMVQDLVNNQWLFVISIDPDNNQANLCLGTGHWQSLFGMG